MSWQKVQLSTLCSAIIDCVNKTAPLSFEKTPYKMLRTSNIRNGRIDTEDVKYVSRETYEKWTRRCQLLPEDIIFTREAPLGEVGMVVEPEGFFLGQRLVLFRTNPEVCYPKYLLYVLQDYEVKNTIVSGGVGSTVTHMRVPECAQIQIPCPPLEIQKRIADTLYTYDTLIENNRKQIKLLEEAARRLYKEWFVDLRFPGHEHTPIVNGIPEGWTMLQTADVITFDPSVKLEKGQTRENVPMTALSTSGCTLDKSLITRTTSCSGSRFQNGDTLLARISPSLENGKTAYVQGLEGPAVGSTEYIVMRGKSIPSIMVYLYARTENFRKVAIGSMKGSDGRQRAQKDMLTSLPYIKAPDTLLKDFEGIAQPMFTLIEQLCTYNQHLTEARDRLLPKLMSGEIAIK